ncbi:hypothetical protein [Ruminococcus sp. Marseille-P6503]|uniref:hypothetical protein n=1 Tax=Ruminococcus sp. Marseille-P6503 TaxID=2364796 RepID=UPI000F51EF76|nr:hypothetical protein [Ruminococcus sp. Marseille-P6503]
MNENMKIITDARLLIKEAAMEHCRVFNDLCGSSCAEAILSVLDGEMRMAVSVQKLEQFFTNGEAEPAANEYEVNKFKNSESL